MFVKTEGPADAKIMLVGEAPGYAGKTLDRMLTRAGIARHECLLTNVARVRPAANKISLYFEDKRMTIPKPELKEWIDLLKKEIMFYKPNVIVALGRTALWALTGEEKITDFRGFVQESTLVPGTKVISTWHPQAVNYEWDKFYPAVIDLKKALKHSNDPAISEDDRVLVTDANVKDFIGYVDFIADDKDVEKVTFDLETTMEGCHPKIIGLGHSAKFAMSFQLINGKIPVIGETAEIAMWRAIANLFDKKPVIMHNASFDMGVMWHKLHILIREIYMDTLIAAHVCWPELPRGLGFLTSICLDVPAWKGSAKYNEVLYNAQDVVNTHALAEFFTEEMRKLGVRHTFDSEMAQIRPALFMQLQGVLVDQDKKKELIEEQEGLLKQSEAALADSIGKVINYNSSKQVCQLLYYELGLPPQFKRRKSKDDPRILTADKKALKKLAIDVPDNAVFQLILECRRLSKLIGGFLLAEQSPDNRAHTSYNVTGKNENFTKNADEEGNSSFGRWSSSKSIIIPYGSGNLQNIPPKARMMYCAPPGYTIVQADYIQAEAVVVAFLCNDTKLKKMFADSFGKRREVRAKNDIHIYTASMMFSVEADQVTKPMRRIGKIIRHSGNYDAGPTVIADQLGVKLSVAKELSNLYKTRNPQLKVWHGRVVDELRQTRTLTTPMGRKHIFLKTWDDDLFRSAYSYIPQSTVGDLLNSSMVAYYNNYCEDDESIYLQLHDAIYVICPISFEGSVMLNLRDCMIKTMTVNGDDMTIDVDFKVGTYWGDMKEVDWQDYVEE